MTAANALYVAIRTISVLGAIIIGLATVATGPLSAPALVFIGVALFGMVLPRASIGVGLAVLPFAGNRPASAHAWYALVGGAALALGLFFAAIRKRCDPVVSGAPSRTENGLDSSHTATTDAPHYRHPLIGATIIYCLISAASLISVPINHLIDDLRNVIDTRSLDTMAQSLVQIMRTDEHGLIYSPLSVFLTFLACDLSFHVFHYCTVFGKKTSQQYIGAVGAGLVASCFIGLADYYGAVDLRFFRPLDPIVNPGNHQFRLQSLFAHSGWYAEYVTLAAPTCLILLTLRAPFWVRTILMLSLLALGEFVLILTYQRGGWISYPTTLIAVWAAIYAVRCIERGEQDLLRALKRSIGKVLLSLPVTVSVSLLLVFFLQGKGSVSASLDPYVARFRDIQKTSDRSDFLRAGTLIGIRHPLLGGGSESFAWQFSREFEDPSGAFVGRYVLPLHGTAHNVFAQTFAGKGIIGLVSLLSLPALLLAICLSTLKDTPQSTETKLVTLVGGCFATAFLVYGNVQEVFYIQSLQYLFFAIIAIVAATTPRFSLRVRASPFLARITTTAIIGGHLVWEFVYPGYTAHFYREARLFGCYAAESSPQGDSFRWCGEHSRITVPHMATAHSPTVVLEAGPLAQEITISSPGHQHLPVSLAPGEKRSISLNSLRDENRDIIQTIRIDTSQSFVPSQLWPTSTDNRRLAVKVYESGG